MHAEAVFPIRKMLMELAKKHFKELEKMNVNTVLGHISDKTMNLEQKFLEHVERDMKFEKTKPVPVFDFVTNVV